MKLKACFTKSYFAMLVINYNLGENSRTIITDEVISPVSAPTFTSMLSDEEKEKPLDLIQDFFHVFYPIPESRHQLNMIYLKATAEGKVTDWKSLSDMFLFVKHFKKLIEAAYIISKNDIPSTVVETTTKINMVPKHILEKSKRFNNIQGFLPSATDPSDSLDPIKNLKVMFAEKSLGEMIQAFDQTYKCALFGIRAESKFYQDHLLNYLIYNIILDSCHLVYVRTFKSTEKENKS